VSGTISAARGPRSPHKGQQEIDLTRQLSPPRTGLLPSLTDAGPYTMAPKTRKQTPAMPSAGQHDGPRRKAKTASPKMSDPVHQAISR